MRSTSYLIASVFCVTFCVSTAKAEEGADCKTPNGETAKCVSIYSCKLLLDAVRSKETKTLNFLRESQCGYTDTPLVCCGTATTYVTWTSGAVQIVRNASVNLPSRASVSSKAIASRKECGYMAYEDKLLSGRITEIDEFPWMALLQYKVKGSEKYTFLCGGSLIGPRYVVTAAHCVTGKINQKYSLTNVRLGEWNVETAKDCVVVEDDKKDCSDPPINIDIEEAIPHPEFNDNSRGRYNDIALLRLKERVNYSDFINPICLPTPTDETIDGQNMYLAGWGKTENSNFSNVKLKLRVPKVSPSDCRNLFSMARVNLGKGQICAGGENKKGSCTGDSGGPLMNVVKNNPAQWYMEGLVSFGTTCGKEGWPGIYTKVSEYTDWIQRNVRD